MSKNVVADVIVVGAGAAGCSAARAFSERGADVVVLEAGPPAAAAPAALHAADYLAALTIDAWRWPGNYLRGLGVGGSTAINGMVTEWPSDDTVRRWAAVVPGDLTRSLQATWDLVSPHRVSADQRGTVDQALSAVAAQHQWLVRSLELCCSSQGQRRTAADIFLSGTSVVVSALSEATQIDLEHLCITLLDGTTLRGSRIVLAAGAHGSPALLANSGLDIAVPAQDHAVETIVLSGTGDMKCTYLSGIRVDIGSAWVLPLARTLPLRTPSSGALLVLGPDGPAVTRAATTLRTALTTAAAGPVPAGERVVFHAAASLPIGEVLGPYGEVPEAPGLQVVDASALPQLGPEGPWFSVAALARHCATES